MLVARTATANIVNIVCPKEEGIIASKLQQRTNQEARFAIFIPGAFQSKGPPGPARGTPWPYPRGGPGRPADMKIWSPCCAPTRWANKRSARIFCTLSGVELYKYRPVGNLEVWAPKKSTYEKRTSVLKIVLTQPYSTIKRIELNARIGMPSANLFFSFGDEGRNPHPPTRASSYRKTQSSRSAFHPHLLEANVDVDVADNTSKSPLPTMGFQAAKIMVFKHSWSLPLMRR